MATSKKKGAKARPTKPTGLALVDGLASIERPTLKDFVDAASQYIVAAVAMEPIEVEGKQITVAARKKAAQIRLSNALGRALVEDLKVEWPEISANAGEITVSGALRASQVDVVEMSPLDGLKLAVELKPINLAVGRAIWNRFGDIRVNAVSTHLKYPFAVAGGVITVPTVEWVTSKKAPEGEWRSTELLIRRLCELLRRAGGRRREDDAPHRLEGVAVVAFDPRSAKIIDDLPPVGMRLRWEEAVADLASSYVERFPPADVALASAGGSAAEEAEDDIDDAPQED